MSPWFTRSYSSIPRWVSLKWNRRNTSPRGNRCTPGTPTSITKQPPGSRCAATFWKQATCSSCVVKFPIVIRPVPMPSSSAAPSRANSTRKLTALEGTACREVEAGVVPVAGKDPVADGAAIKRKAHVRAAVVDRVHLLTVRKEAKRVPVEADDESAGGAQFRERRSADVTDVTLRGYGGHGSLSFHQKRGSSGSAAASSSRLT